jgi:hypothetical protein
MDAGLARVLGTCAILLSLEQASSRRKSKTRYNMTGGLPVYLSSLSVSMSNVMYAATLKLVSTTTTFPLVRNLVHGQ